MEFLTTFFSPQSTAHPWYLNTDYRESGWKMKDTLVGFIKTQLEMLEEDELITRSWNSDHLYFTPFPDTSIRTTKNEANIGRIYWAPTIQWEARFKLLKWSFTPPFFSPRTTSHPWYLNTDYRELWSENGGILLVGIIETQLKIDSQQGSPRLTKGCPKPIINLKRQHQKTTISA